MSICERGRDDLIVLLTATCFFQVFNSISSIRGKKWNDGGALMAREAPLRLSSANIMSWASAFVNVRKTCSPLGVAA
jgi:hypothetical protein